MGKKGQAEVFIVALMLVAVVFVVAMCSHGSRPHHKKVATVSKLKPECSGTTCKGTYAYKNDTDGMWFYYTFTMDSGSASQPNPYANYGSSLPRGGTWTKGTEPKEELENENDEQVEMDEADNGDPSSDAADSSDSGSSDSGSSDSGGSDGGDGGGD